MNPREAGSGFDLRTPQAIGLRFRLGHAQIEESRGPVGMDVGPVESATANRLIVGSLPALFGDL